MIAPRPYFVLPQAKLGEHRHEVAVADGRGKIHLLSAEDAYAAVARNGRPPPFAGGQGRSAREVVGTAMRTSWLLRLLALAGAALALWSLLR